MLLPPGLDVLMPLLACPEADHHCRFEFTPTTGAEARQWTHMLREPTSIPHKLVCRESGLEFPVTADGIPVMWSSELRETFEHLDVDVDGACPSERDVKSANIHVYESIVDSYDLAGVHADPVTVGRLQSAFLQSVSNSQVPHLDVGCGGGNVLTIMREVCGRPQIGLDVSLAGLRVVRRKGFHAILGDAERLPVRAGSVGLVTSSSVLHHLFAPERLIGEAARVLGPGGIFLTDFDPHRRAAEWGWLARQLYGLRMPVYRLMSGGRKRVFHADERIQTWNEVAEFHNGPGSGFEKGHLERILGESGFHAVDVFPHNCQDANVTRREFARPSLRHFVVQTLSGRNPFARRNADTLLTISSKSMSPTVRAA